MNLSAQVTATNEWISFYSSNTFLNGELVPVGSLIAAYDSDNRLCGVDTVKVSGQYGFLQVYRDDPSTPSIDEGAEPGDTIYISINGYFTRSIPGIIPFWISNGDRIELDLEAWSNWNPIITDISDQTIFEGEGFNPISLNEFISDPDHSNDQLTWTCSGFTELSIMFSGNTATINAPNENWFGSEKVAFRATDPEGLFAQDSVRFTIIAVNDTPKVSKIQNQHISDLESFQLIVLDEYVYDVDDTDDQISWITSGTQNLTVTIINRIAEIGISVDGWTGSETILFTATDRGLLSDSTTATFTVLNVYDTPIIDSLPIINFKEDKSLIFSSSHWYDFVEDPVHADSQLSFRIDSGTYVYVETEFDSISIWAEENWFGSDSLYFLVTDGEHYDSNYLRINVLPVNDCPVIELPDTILIENDSTIQICVWDYVSDIESQDSLLCYRFFSYTDLMTLDYIPESGMLEVLFNYQYNGSCKFIVSAIDDSGATSVDSIFIIVKNPVTDIINSSSNSIPRHFFLEQNYPNPFNPQTIIEYAIPVDSEVLLTVFNTFGQKVATLVNQRQRANRYRIAFDAARYHLSSGIYFYQLQTGTYQQVRKLLYLK